MFIFKNLNRKFFSCAHFKKLGCYPDKISGSSDPADQQADNKTLPNNHTNNKNNHLNLPNDKKSKLDESDHDSEKNLKCKTAYFTLLFA